MASAAGASQGTTFVTSSGGPGEGGGSLEALANDPTLWTEEPPEKPEQATAGVSLLERLIDPEFQQPFADSEMELINFKRVVVIPPEKHKETVAAVMLLKKLLRACSVCGATELRVLKNSGAKTPHRLILRIHGRLTEAGVLDHGKTRLIKGVINTLSGVAAGQTDNAGNGTFSARLPGRQVYYLVKSPDRFEGTELFVRVLDKQRVPMHLKDVGLAPTVLKPIQSTLSGEGGLLLLAGPPNAGRTTSLYAMLRAFDVHQHRIVTIEDEPIYAVDGITQVPVDHSKDLHLAKLMKLAIRQKRPQVMLLSELDDERAAQQAVKAAANGTLVLAEFRARDAAEAMLRLAVRSGPMLGMLTDALKLVVAQRMVRQLCPHCKVETPVKPEQRQRYGKPFQGLDRIYSQWSCDKCLGIGYQGMLPIVETVHPSLELMARIEQGVPLATLRQSLRQAQPRGLWQAGGEAIAAGETAIAEVERVLSAVPM
jgi:type II secretory ATPase GspE/PulE/Tfp pilus assembly ATPase PilB-like protein